jgi:hypothetical protein
MRNRTIDIEKLSKEQVDDLSKQIGEKIGKKINAVCDEIKKLLEIYNLDIKMTYFIHPIGDNPLEMLAKEQEVLKSEEKQEVVPVVEAVEPPKPKKRGRPKKKS